MGRLLLTLLLWQPAALEPQFDVASIRPSAPGYGNSTSIHTSNNTFTTRNTPLIELIRMAYRAQSYQVHGAPAWVHDERYDIAAKFDAEPEKDAAASRAAGQEHMRARLRHLLRDRFQLKLREERRELPVFALVAEKSGVKLKAAEKPTGNMNVNGNNGNGTLRGEGVTMARLCETLGRIVSRPVTDESGQAGAYDVDLRWFSDNAAESGPNIFTALREQLGLRLDARKGPVTAYVIESVEKPSEN